MTIKSCFRSYKDSEQSYIDHSDFLTDPKKEHRYGPLFELDPTDYKKWAKGLKKAGYATSNTYDKKLIDIIEKYELYKYDQGVPLDPIASTTAKPANDDKMEEEFEDGFVWGATPDQRPPEPEFEEEEEPVNTTSILINNGAKYVNAAPGEQVNNISVRTGTSVRSLLKYNENLTDGSQKLDMGTVVYLQPKRGSYRGRETYHTVAEGETMFDISHEYGVSLTKLYKRNLLVQGQEPARGEKIKLKGGTVRIAPVTTAGAVVPDRSSQEPESNRKDEVELDEDSISEDEFGSKEEEKPLFVFGSKKKNKEPKKEKSTSTSQPTKTPNFCNVFDLYNWAA